MLAKTFFMVLAIPFSYVLYLRFHQIQVNFDYLDLEQHQILNQGDLLDANLNLNEVGWAKQPLKKFNSSALSFWQRNFRLKQWNFYQVSNDEFFLSLALVDLGFAQNIQVTFFDFESDTLIHKDQIVLPIIHQRLQFSDHPIINTSQELKQVFNSNDLHVVVLTKTVLNNQEETYLNISMSYKEHKLEAEFKIRSQQEWDRIVTITPINEQKDQFYYNMKSYNWYVKGQLYYDQKNYEIMEFSSNAGIDWGRGIWNYHTFWIWASAMGFDQNGKRIGINLGGGFQNEQEGKATEESIFINRVLYKLCDLTYSYDLNNLDVPFEIKSHNVSRQDFNIKISWEKDDSDVQVQMEQDQTNQSKPIPGQFYCQFMPVHKNKRNTELLIISVNFEQYFGLFTGAYVLESGELYEFNQIFGVIEFNKANW